MIVKIGGAGTVYLISAFPSMQNFRKLHATSVLTFLPLIRAAKALNTRKTGR